MSRRQTPNIYTIPAQQNFADTLAAGLMERVDGDPLALSAILVLLPNRRAVRALSNSFLKLNDGKVMLMPEMRPIGDVDEGAVIGLSGSLVGQQKLWPAISENERNVLLSRLIERWAGARDRWVSPAQSWHLARMLARLMDQVENEELSYDALTGLVSEDFAGHWQDTLDFLDIVTNGWPAILAERQLMNPAARRNRQLTHLAESWESNPPDKDIIAAGSTGTMAATARLLGVIARLPRGHVVLPGLDTSLDDESWDAIDPTHPQYTLKQLLEGIGEHRENVDKWCVRAPNEASGERITLLREAMRPAACTGSWLKLRENGFKAHTATENLTFVVADTAREEAEVIALKLRETLEIKGKTAALITPDRHLARQVAATMKRWSIALDDSAGQPALNSTLGSFLRHVIRLIEQGMAPDAFLSLLQHPLSSAAMEREKFRGFVRRVDYALLRGPSPAKGIAGLIARGKERLKRTKAGKIKIPREKWQAADQKTLEDFLALFTPLQTLFDQERVAVADLLSAHIAVAEAVAQERGGDPTNLWKGEAGATLADGLSDLLSALASADAIMPQDYPALFDMMIAPMVVRRHFGKHPRVFIWGAIEARLQRADVMILGGLNEGVWPAESDPDPWMSRKMRSDFGLAPLERRIGQSAHDFVQAFGAKEVMVTRSAKAGGAETVASRWLYRMEALLGADVVSGPARFLTYAREIYRPTEPQQKLSPPAPTPPVKARPRSLYVTSIEAWMRDPYGLYAKQILGLRVMERVADNPNAAHKGSLIHEVLEDFLRSSGTKKGVKGEKRLIELGRVHFKQFSDQPAVETFWWPRFKAIAKEFITIMNKRSGDFSVAALEAKGEAKIPDVDFTVKAIADRLDLHRDTNRILVMDYKTGEPPSKAQMMGGYAPQLPLEGWIVQKGGFEGVEAREVLGGEYWKVSGKQEKPIEIKSPLKSADFVDLISQSVEGLKNLVVTFSNPDIPYLSNPRPQMVKYSDYDHLSRVKEWRAGEGEGS